MKYLLATIFCLFLNNTKALAQDLATEFNRAMDAHLARHLDIACQRLAPKLGITMQQLKDALKVERGQRQLTVTGYVRLPQSLCEVDGNFAALDKSLRAMCLNDQHQLQIFY